MYRGFDRQSWIAVDNRRPGNRKLELVLAVLVFALLFSASVASVAYNIEAITAALTLTDATKERLSWDPFAVLGLFALFISSCVFYFLVLLFLWYVAKKTARALTTRLPTQPSSADR